MNVDVEEVGSRRVSVLSADDGAVRIAIHRLHHGRYYPTDTMGLSAAEADALARLLAARPAVIR